MSRRPSRTRPLQPPPQATAEEIRQGIVRLKKRLDEVSAFEPTSVTEQNNIPHVEALSAAVDEALIRTFGADTLDYKRYSELANRRLRKIVRMGSGAYSWDVLRARFLLSGDVPRGGPIRPHTQSASAVNDRRKRNKAARDAARKGVFVSPERLRSRRPN
jgi:hypothetical protein